MDIQNCYFIDQEIIRCKYYPFEALNTIFHKSLLSKVTHSTFFTSIFIPNTYSVEFCSPLTLLLTNRGWISNQTGEITNLALYNCMQLKIKLNIFLKPFFARGFRAKRHLTVRLVNEHWQGVEKFSSRPPNFPHLLFSTLLFSEAFPFSATKSSSFPLHLVLRLTET